MPRTSPGTGSCSGFSSVALDTDGVVVLIDELVLVDFAAAMSPSARILALLESHDEVLHRRVLAGLMNTKAES